MVGTLLQGLLHFYSQVFLKNYKRYNLTIIEGYLLDFTIWGHLHKQEFFLCVSMNMLKHFISNFEIHLCFSAGQQGMTASKSFMAIWMRMTTERARAILKIHPEFRNLSDVEQVIFTSLYLLFEIKLVIFSYLKYINSQESTGK